MSIQMIKNSKPYPTLPGRRAVNPHQLGVFSEGKFYQLGA